MVGTVNMTTNKPSDAAVVNIKGTNKALVLTVDCNARYVNNDPEVGTMIAVAEAARNIVCSGGIPVAITNCLNFGNPYNPEVYWQFVGAIKGMSKACAKFETPVTGGNVSFYNQSTIGDKTEPVFPTTTIGMLGILDSKKTFTGIGFKKVDDLIYLIGESVNDINSSEYLYSYVGIKNSPAPYFDLDKEYAVQKATTELINQDIIASANDCSDGGLFIAVLESAMVSNLSFHISTSNDIRKDAFLFGEAQSRIIVSIEPSQKRALENTLSKLNVSFLGIGTVAQKEIKIDGNSFGNCHEYKRYYDNALSTIMTEE